MIVTDEQLLAHMLAVAPIPGLDRMAGVYGVECAGFIKIGFASSVVGRVNNFRVSCPLDITLVFQMTTDRLRAQVLERCLHVHFATRLHRGEWYAITAMELAATRKHLDNLSARIQHQHIQAMVSRGEYAERYETFELAQQSALRRGQSGN